MIDPMAGRGKKKREPRGAGGWSRLRLDPRGLARDIGAFSLYVLRRAKADSCLRVGASLSYTTLLALVPLLTIGFAMLSAFPVFSTAQGEIQGFIFENFVPSAGGSLTMQFANFSTNAGKLSSIGIVALAITALMLFSTIESAFNAIWRETQPRPIVARLLMYWAMLTLTPLLLGTSLGLSSYIFTVTKMVGIGDAFGGPLGQLLRLTPFLLLVVGFSLLFIIIPNRRVQWRHAAAGGLLAALLFSALKQGFAFYVVQFPSYQTIYGALAALPLFLVWMYLVWSVVLLGAELTASLPEWRQALRHARTKHARPGQRLGLALAILAALKAASRNGDSLTIEDLLQGASGDPTTDPEFLAPVLNALSGDRYITRTSNEEKWILARDLDRTTLYDLHRSLGLDTRLDGKGGGGEWRARAGKLLTSVDAAQSDLMKVSLNDLVTPKLV